MTHPYQVVQGPPIQPYKFGLESVALPQPTDGPHWQLGVEYEPISAYQAGVWPGACNGDTPDPLDLPDGAGLNDSLPFSVYAGVDCKLVGYSPEYVMTRARAILDLSWQHAAEDALWAGEQGNAPHLNQAGTPLSSGGIGIVDAIALIEDYLGENYGGTGVIHARRSVAAYAAQAYQLYERSGPTGKTQLQTALGTAFVFGGGYDGTGPGGVAPGAGNTWIYGTGIVTVRRGEPIPSGDVGAALNRTTNESLFFVEQPTVLTVDGPIVAVKVDLTP